MNLQLKKIPDLTFLSLRFLKIYKKTQSTCSNRRDRNRFLRRMKGSLLGILQDGLRAILLFILMLQVSVGPLLAQSTTIFRDVFRQGSDGRLERQYQRADQMEREDEWESEVERGFGVLRADWEVIANRELDREVTRNGGDSQLRNELEREKAIAKAEWESEVQKEMDERKGIWRAKIESNSLSSHLLSIPRDELRNAVLEADAYSRSGGNATEKLERFDFSLDETLGVIRSSWEEGLVSDITGILTSVNFGSEVERDSFEKKLLEIQQLILAEYFYEESSLVASYRAGFVRRENQNEDMSNRIAQETDPSELARLLIARTKDKVNQDFGGYIPPNGTNLGTPNPALDMNVEDYSQAALAALEEGQKQWQLAIDDLLLGKLRYDREVERGYREGDADWTDAYGELLKAQKEWNDTVKEQIQRGLAAWDQSELDLIANRTTAMEELDRTLATQTENWQAHVRGLENVVLGGADMLSMIVSNRDYFDGAHARALKNTDDYPQAVIDEYLNQKNYWQNMEYRIRNLVASSQNQIHNVDIRGTGIGQGLLSNNGAGDNYVYSTLELELKISREELRILEEKQARAQKVYDYAVGNVEQVSTADMEEELANLREAMKERESAYVVLLSELNGGGALTYSETNLDENAKIGTEDETEAPETTLLDELEQANEVLEERRKDLELARKALEESRIAYESAIKLQVLMQNPSMLGEIGELPSDATGSGNTGLRAEIESARVELERQREVLRQREGEMYRYMYEKENAVRSQDFYNSTFLRIIGLESTKESKELLSQELSSEGSLVDKINHLLDENTLVVIYGNEVAEEKRSNLREFKALLETIDEPVLQSATTITNHTNSLDAFLSNHLNSDATGAKNSLFNHAQKLDDTLESFFNISGIEIGYLELEELYYGNNYLKNLILDWDEMNSVKDAGKADLTSAMQAYKDYVENTTDEVGSLAYTKKILELSSEVSYGTERLDAYQSYINEINQTLSSLNSLVQDRVQRSQMLVDSSLTGDARSNARSSIDVIRTEYGVTHSDGIGKLSNLVGSFSELGLNLEALGAGMLGYRSSLEKRQHLRTTVSETLLSYYADLDMSFGIRKSELEFLLKEGASEEDLLGIESELRKDRNVEGAITNQLALEKLLDAIGGLTGSERNIEKIYLRVLSDLDDISSRPMTDQASLRDRRSQQLLFEYVKNNKNMLDGMLKSNDYDGFVSYLESEIGYSSSLLQFYESGGEYSQEERDAIRSNGSQNEKRMLADYYHFGETFFFQQTPVFLGTETSVLESYQNFKENVLSGSELSVLTDDYYINQENRVTGILSEIHQKVPGLENLTAHDFYTDSFAIGTEGEENYEEINRRKNLLNDWLGSDLNNLVYMQSLLNYEQLGTIFLLQDIPGIYNKARDMSDSYLSAQEAYLNSFSDIARLEEVKTQIDDTRSLYSDEMKTKLETELAQVKGLLAMKDFKIERTFINDDEEEEIEEFFPFGGIDFSHLNSLVVGIEDRLENWESIRDSLESSSETYDQALEDLSEEELGTEEFFSQLALVQGELEALNSLLFGARSNVYVMSDDLSQSYLLMRDLSPTIKSYFGLDPNRLYMSDDYNIVPDGVEPENYVMIEELFGQDIGIPGNEAELVLGEIARFDNLMTSGSMASISLLGEVNEVISKQNLTQLALNELESVSNKRVYMEGIDAEMGVYRENLPDKIIAYMGQGDQNQISTDDLIGYVDGLRTLFLDKDLSNEPINQALKEALETAGAYTDEISYLKYYQSLSGSELENAEDNWKNALKYQENLEKIEKVFHQLNGILSALSQSKQPLSSASAQLTQAMAEYKKLQKEVTDSGYELSSPILEGMEKLETYLWDMHKAELAQGYLKKLGDGASLTSFMSEVEAGKFVLNGSQGTVERNAKFLGNDMDATQLAELRSFLSVYDTQARITNLQTESEIEALLLDKDPELREEMKRLSNIQFYDKYQASLANGTIPPVSQLPTELRDYGIVSGFLAYLLVSDWDENDEEERKSAVTDYSQRIGGDSNTVLFLDEFISHYGERNASYYLPDYLQERDVVLNYYRSNSAKELQPDDYIALASWLAEEGYEGSLVSSLNRAVRMEYIIQSSFGEDDEELYSYLSTRLAGGITEEEKIGFYQSGAGVNPLLENYNPLGRLGQENNLKSFQLENDFSDLVEAFDVERRRLAHEGRSAKEATKRNRFVFNMTRDVASLDTYLSYTQIGVTGQLEPDRATKIENKIRSLEFEAEHRLANFLSVIEEYNSNSFDIEKADANPSIKRAVGYINESGYELREEVYTKNDEGYYDFIPDIDNLKVSIGVYLKSNLPGFSAIDDPYAWVRQSRSGMQSSEESIVLAGQTIGQITLQAQTYAGLNGAILKAQMASDLAGVRNEHNTRQSAFETAQQAFNSHQTVVDGIKTRYSDKTIEIQEAYKLFEESQKALSDFTAVYDYATLLEYSTHESVDGFSSSAIRDAKDLAKKRLDEARKETLEKKAEIEELEKRKAKEMSLATLQNDPDVQREKAETKEWAERAIRFSKAETAIKERMKYLKSQVDAERATLHGHMNSLLNANAIPSNLLDGRLDFSSPGYKGTEEEYRRMYHIAEGVSQDQIGFWDFVMGAIGGSPGSPPSYGGGQSQKHPHADIRKYIQEFKQGNLTPDMNKVKNAYFGIHPHGMHLDPNGYAHLRLTYPNYDDYHAAMEGKLGDELFRTTAVFLVLILFFGIPEGVNWTLISQATSLTGEWGQASAKVGETVGKLKASADKLKELQAELNYYTDIDSAEQLREVMLGDGQYSLETFLDESDMDLLTDVDGNQAAGRLSAGSLQWRGGKEPLNLDRIAGKNGNPVAQDRAIHDEYGLYIRDGKAPVGGMSSTINGADLKDRKSSYMVSADEFASALASMSQSQYEIERDEYFSASDNAISADGVRADRREILNDREAFYAALIQQESNNNGSNIEYDMYKVLVNDYMGQGKIIDELYSLNVEQQKKVQIAAWDTKEKEFYAKKKEWIENIEFLQETGQTRFDDMIRQFNREWDGWRQDYRQKADEGEKKHIAKIEEALKKKADWEKSFLQNFKGGNSAVNIRKMYDDIQSQISELAIGLPTHVAASIDVNKILNNVMANRPDVLDEALVNAGSYQDVQFFIDRITSADFDDSNIQKLDELQKDMDNATRKMTVLQTLDSLYMIPGGFEEIIKGANEGLQDQLAQRLIPEGFFPMGNGFVRQVPSVSGGTEMQFLPNYAFFRYKSPGLPEVKDANGKTWNLNDYEALSGENGPSSTELTVMVRLAKNDMEETFRKQTYDPDPNNAVNHEVAFTLADPRATARVQQAATSALQRLYTDPEQALKFSQADDTGKERMIESAKNSGYLVGPTEGGAFGKHHFDQFYAILKLKEKYDEQKAEGEALKNDGFANAAGSALSVVSMGMISPNQAARFLNENSEVIDTIATVAAVVATPFTGGASLVALSAYKAAQGAYAGGIMGAITGAASGFSSITGVDVSYTYEDGFGASVGVNLGAGVSLGLNYSDKDGFGASLGVDLGGGFKIGASYSESGGFGVNAGFKSGSTQIGLNYSEKDGFSGRVGLAGDGYRAGLNYSKNEGVGVYAGKSLDNGELEGTRSAEIGWDKSKGFQASYGSDEIRATYSQADGFGAKISQDLGAGMKMNASLTQRGGFSTSLSGEVLPGVNGSLSYNSNTGFSASIAGKFNGTNMNLGLSEGGKLSFDHSDSNQEESLFIDNMAALQSKNDSDIQKAKQKIIAESYSKYQDEMISLNKELEDLKNDPEAFAKKVSELDKSGKLNHPADNSDAAAIDSGGSRKGFFDKALGFASDLGESFLGSSVAFGTGYVDKNGKFHQRTCFVAGTKVHTDSGLKSIEDVRIGDVVLSKSDVTGETSYKRVVNTFIRQTQAIYKVTFEDGTVLETTWNHPFRRLKLDSVLIGGLQDTSGDVNQSMDLSEWIEAKELKSGDLTFTAEGKLLAISSIEVDGREETVYNFEVEDFHTYFVGEVGVWVHNDEGYADKVINFVKETKEHIEKKIDTKKEEIAKESKRKIDKAAQETIKNTVDIASDFIDKETMGDKIRGYLTSEFEIKLFDHYWQGSGTQLNLSEEEFSDLVNASRPVPGSTPTKTEKGLYKQTYRTYANADYDQALGDYTLYTDKKGKALGMKDYYNFDSRTFFGPNSRPTIKGEVQTQMVDSAGINYNAKGYKIKYGKTD